MSIYKNLDEAQDFLEEAVALADAVSEALERSNDFSAKAETNLSSIQDMFLGIADDADRGELDLTRDLHIVTTIADNTKLFVEDLLEEVSLMRQHLKSLSDQVSKGAAAIGDARLKVATLASNDFCEDAVQDAFDDTFED